MDRLSTYALVAAIKELYEKQPGAAKHTDNARWVSLRTWMADSDASQWIPSLDEASAPVDPPALAARPGRGYISQIAQRHQRALELAAKQQG